MERSEQAGRVAVGSSAEAAKARPPEGDLFIGVISGWETEIGSDFDTRKSLGYCALTNAGYSDKNQPADMDDALSKIVQEFIEL